MSLSKIQKDSIKALLSKKIENKLKLYGRETKSMPFLARLIQDNEKIAAYSFIHSMATTLGISIYEDVSVIIASDTSQECFRKYGVGGVISKDQKRTITGIITKLRNGSRKANIKKEIEEVLKASCKDGEFQNNPYHPKPYSRFTEVGMMDIHNDFLVGNEYWDFIGGENTFSELLEVFNEVGKTFKVRLERKFKEIAKEKIDSY